MIPGINPRQMQKMMQRMGISQVEIPAKEVIIKTEDKDIIIVKPSVSKVNMMGQDTFQITGNVYEREAKAEIEISKDDIAMVAEQANVSEDKAKQAIEETKGDIAEAILKLKEE